MPIYEIIEQESNDSITPAAPLETAAPKINIKEDSSLSLEHLPSDSILNSTKSVCKSQIIVAEDQMINMQVLKS